MCSKLAFDTKLHKKSRGNINECRTVLVKNLIKERFYRKRKKTINILSAFFISHKSDDKTFIKLILKQCHTAPVNMAQSQVRGELLYWNPIILYYIAKAKIQLNFKLESNFVPYVSSNF